MSVDKAVILVADDEDRFRDALVDALTFFGYNVQQARTGEELCKAASQLIDAGQPYLLIVDNQMPERPGDTERQWCGFHQVVALCRNRPAAGIGSRVLFLSRWGIQDLPNDDRTEGQKFGLIDDTRWLPVHIPFSTLKGHINRLLSRG
jgi:CheY-like chemotaxis protein